MKGKASTLEAGADIPCDRLRLDRESDTPLYLQLREALEHGIASGAITAGQRLPPEPVLCEALGISTLTVKNAIAPLVEAGMLYRRPRLGTFVAEGAVRRRIRIGVLTPAPAEDGFQAALVPGTSFHLHAQGYASEIVFQQSEESPTDLDLTMVLGPIPPDQQPWLASLTARAGSRILCVDVPPVLKDADFVYVDNRHAARRVVERLIGSGARRILYYGMGAREALNDAERLAGYRAALKKRGLAFRRDRVLQPFPGTRPSKQLAAAVKRLSADAVFLANGGFYGSLLSGLVSAGSAKDMPRIGGIGLPASVSGVENYHVDARDLGRAAAEIVDRRLQGDGSSQICIGVKGKVV